MESMPDRCKPDEVEKPKPCIQEYSTREPRHQSGHNFLTTNISGDARVHQGNIYYNFYNRQRTEDTRVKGDFNLPFHLTNIPLIHQFIDRQSDIIALERILLPAAYLQRREIVILHGMGGVGKTQLAIEFARRHQKVYSSIFFVHADSKESLLNSFLAISRRVRRADQSREDNPPNSTAQLEEIAKQVLTWLDSEGNDSWLLIFDNVDREPSDIGGFNIKAYFPMRDVGSILLTTRLASFPVDAHRISLSPMNGIQSLRLLRSYQPSVRSVEAETKLLDSLAGLPLALSQAGRFISTLNIDIEEYLDLYNSSKPEIMNLLPSSIYGEESKGSSSVATSWTTSINLLKERMSLEDECGKHYRGFQLLKLFAYFDPTNLDYEVLRRGLVGNDVPSWFRTTFQSKPAFYLTIQVLLDLSLLDKTETTGSYAMHRVMYEWLVNILVRDTDINFLTLAVAAVGFSAPDIFTASWSHDQARLILHAKALLPRLLQYGHSLPHMDFRLLSSEELEYTAVLLDDEPEPLQLRGVECPLRFLCQLLWADGKKTEVRCILNQSIKYLQAQGITEDDPVLLVLTYATYTKMMKVEVEKAEDELRRLRSTFDSLNLPYWAIKTGNNQALNLMQQGKTNEAVSCWQALLKESCGLYGPLHTLTSMVFNNVTAYFPPTDLCKAKEHIGCIRTEAEAMASIKPSARQALYTLGVMYSRCGDFKEADKLFRRVLDVEIPFGEKIRLRPGGRTPG